MGGVSFVEILILYELWAAERLVLETALPKFRRRERPITVKAGSGSAETVIWRSCRFVGALFRALKDLPGGLARFIPGGIGGNHRRLLRIRWEQCGHGLTCRPQESRSHALLDALLVLFGKNSGSASALLDGTLRLKYCKRPFARLFPSWSLTGRGHVQHIVHGLFGMFLVPWFPGTLLEVLVQLALEELEALVLEELEGLGLEELEALALEELEAPGLEELEALVVLVWLEDLEAI